MAGKINAPRGQLNADFRKPDWPVPILLPDSDINECMSLNARRDLKRQVVDRVSNRNFAHSGIVHRDNAGVSGMANGEIPVSTAINQRHVKLAGC